MGGASHPEAKPCGWGRDRIQEFAARIASAWGYKPGGDLIELVKSLGGQVKVGKIEEVLTTGSITVDGPGDFLISLSPLSGFRRSRFTVAHELGHYVLHSQLGKKRISVQRDGSGPVEWEANWFAAGFLMPEKDFRTRRKAGWGDAELAMHFDVSEAAVQVRRQSLGL
jgi:hypothetical protein